MHHMCALVCYVNFWEMYTKSELKKTFFDSFTLIFETIESGNMKRAKVHFYWFLLCSDLHKRKILCAKKKFLLLFWFSVFLHSRNKCKLFAFFHFRSVQFSGIMTFYSKSYEISLFLFCKNMKFIKLFLLVSTLINRKILQKNEQRLEMAQKESE